MKKIVAMLLALMMVLSLAACGTKEEPAPAPAPEAPAAEAPAEEAPAEEAPAAEPTDMEYVKEKGVLVVGITDFAPMDFKNEAGEWIGFDADMARVVADKLGVDIEFVEIDWNNKILELDAKNIDVVWNGMTLTDAVLAAMQCSNPYMNNAQVVIVPADKAADYQTIESLANLAFAAEAGSAGEAELTALNLNVTPVLTQADALMEVAAGTSDAAVIDSLMAAAMVGEGTNYENLTYTVGLNSEEYGVGFRLDSGLAAALNAFLVDAYEDGSLIAIAETYGVQAALINQIATAE